MGMNAVRLRVWVNHKTGWSNKEDMLTLAKRAAKQGQRLMIDIHYSDFFADPSHQAVPAAWQNYDYETMLEAVREHTLDVLYTLKEAGIKPEWVQIGNETPNGMLWPMARVNKEEGEWAHYAGFTAMGYRSAKEVFPDITVIVHVDNAYEQRDWFWEQMAAHGGKWDMIGLSHYPMMSAWNGGKTWQEMNELAEANIRRLIRQWHCPVMIAEIGMFANDTLSATVMADFVARAKDCVRRIRARGRTPLFVGGTPFYYQALFGGLLSIDVPTDEALRAGLCAQSGEELFARLRDSFCASARSPRACGPTMPRHRRSLIRRRKRSSPT